MQPTEFLRQIAALSPDQAAALARKAGIAAHLLPAPQHLPQLAAAARAIAASLGRSAPAVLLLTPAGDNVTLDQIAPHLLGYDRLYALGPTGAGAGLLAPGQTNPTRLPAPCTCLALLILSPAAS